MTTHTLASTCTPSFQSFIRYAQKTPILSAEDEKRYAKALRENNDLAAAQKLIVSHLRFVAHMAKKYGGYGLNQEDLVQEGNIGLMKAVKRFDERKGVRLVSFAVHWIKAEIHEFVLKNFRIIKVATTKAQRKLFFNLRRMRKNERLSMSEDDIAFVAEELNVPTHEVRTMESRFYNFDQSLETPLGPHEDGETFTVLDTLENIDDTEGDVLNSLELSNNTQLLDNALNALDERSQYIIRARHLQDEKTTLQDLSVVFNVSFERIRQLEVVALSKLKNTLVK
jgi:RNA polymerase sigma-32 factor